MYNEFRCLSGHAPLLQMTDGEWFVIAEGTRGYQKTSHMTQRSSYRTPRGYFVDDGRFIHGLEYTPDLNSPFLWFFGQLREIRDIHRTAYGVQIELYPILLEYPTSESKPPLRIPYPFNE